LLDDPLRNVDAKLRYEMRLELPSLLRRGAAAALYVTQDYREAMAIADRIAVLINGRFEQVATPDEIYSAPASVAVARLFGDPAINLAEIEPFEEHGAVFAMVSGTRIPLGASDGQPMDRPCWLGIRPEQLEISRLAGDGAIRARVLAITPVHEKAVLLLKLADGCEWLAALPPRAMEEVAVEDIFIRFAPEHALLFDRTSGHRICLAHRRRAA
jgi:multiple sugar transport system ATP-binding protein